VGLSEELRVMIHHTRGIARSGSAGIGKVGPEYPWVTGEQALGAFARELYGRLSGFFAQSNIVADSSPNDFVIYSGLMMNRLAALRRARGVSAIALAAHAGITRQAIYAIEAGTYMPNTAVALRLARTLETTVEDLFTLDAEDLPKIETQAFEPLEDSGVFDTGEPVRVCRVGKRMIGIALSRHPAWLPMADGIVAGDGRAIVTGALEDSNRLLIAGCDPALSLLTHHARSMGVEVVLASGNSAQSLEWLKSGKIDIAGSHLNNSRTPGPSFAVVTFALWQEGFVVKRGNPKGIRKIEDLANPRIRFVNREEGSGSRRLFDSLMESAGMPAHRIKACNATVPGHLAAAWAVASGSADCCIAAGSAARRYGLDFIPLAEERFELTLPRRDLTRKSIQTLFEILSRSRFRRELETIAGYDVSNSGEMIS
jgi:molybdate-binding protein/DNA-binding XRE family transcriptional regulator